MQRGLQREMSARSAHAMSEAWTVRLRSLAGGGYSLTLAPSAGLGFSRPCCSDLHLTRTDALDCGTRVLHQLLSLKEAV